MARPIIRLRLTALYAGSIAAILLGATIVTFGLVQLAVDGEFERSLQRGLAVARNTFWTELPEYKTTEATIAHVAGEVAVPDRVVQFVAPDGRVFATAPADRTQRLLPPLRVRSAPLEPALAPGWTVRITASESETHGLRDAMARLAAISLPSIFVLAIVVGWFVTGRALRPVGLMAQATARIAPGSGTRLPVGHPDDELGQLGRRFNALLDRLDEALAQQRRFIADAEHELRTPVARVRTRVEAALAQPPGPRDRDALRQADVELRATSSLLDELLLLARVDAGAAQGPRERVFLDDLAMDAVAGWRPDAARAGVTLAVDVMEETPVLAERTLVARLIGILLDNAIRYTPAGGRVAVRAHALPGAAVLEVVDTGIGIPLAERDRATQRFWRGAEARRLAPQGSGLGLSIARWIVERHEGRLELLPRVDGGTLVRVSLPAAAPVRGEAVVA